MPGAQPAKDLGAEKKPSAEIKDIAEARKNRQEAMQDMLESGDAVRADDGTVVPIDQLDTYQDSVRGEVISLTGQVESNQQVMKTIEEGNFDGARENIKSEQDKLVGMKEEAEKKNEAIGTMRWGAGKLIELGAYVPGSTDLPRLIDRWGGKLATGTEGYILTPVDHARIAKNQAKASEYGLKAIALGVPEAVLLTKAIEPIARARAKIEAKKEALAKEGKELSIQDEMSEFSKALPESFSDPKIVKKLGELGGQAGKAIGGETGDKIETISNFVVSNPDISSKIFKGLKKSTEDKTLAMSPDMQNAVQEASKEWAALDEMEDMGEFEATDEGEVV